MVYCCFRSVVLNLICTISPFVVSNHDFSPCISTLPKILNCCYEKNLFYQTLVSIMTTVFIKGPLLRHYVKFNK